MALPATASRGRLPGDGVSRARSAARAFRSSSSIPVVVGCAPPSTRRAVRPISSNVVTLSRRSSSVAAASSYFVQSRFDERRLRIVLPKIKELQSLVSARDFGPFKGFLVAADVLPLQEDLASFTNALRWALYSWGDDGERANVFFADFAKDGYQAKGYFGFVDECGDYSPWGHTWAVGTRAELDAAGWAEEAFPNEDVADY